MPIVRRLLALAWGWPAVLALAALIFALSSVPNLSPPQPGALPADKLEHAAIYAALAFALAGALRRRVVSPPALAIAAAVALAAAYGASDELHQRFVPGRTAAVDDWLADVAGAAVGALISTLLASVIDGRRGDPSA